MNKMKSFTILVNSLLARPTGHHLLIKFEDPIQGAKNGSKNKILF
jgi:hypothetical protein